MRRSLHITEVSTLIDDEERNGGKQFHLFFASSIERGIGEVIAEGVGFTIEDAITLLNGGLANRLGEMALAGARRTQLIVLTFQLTLRCITVGIRFTDVVCERFGEQAGRM